MRRHILRALRLARLPLAVVFLPYAALGLPALAKMSPVEWVASLVTETAKLWHWFFARVIREWNYCMQRGWPDNELLSDILFFGWVAVSLLATLTSLVWWFRRPSRRSGIALTISILCLGPTNIPIRYCFGMIIKAFGG